MEAENYLKQRDNVKIENMSDGKEVNIGEWAKVRFSLKDHRNFEDDHVAYFYLLKTENGYKIDRKPTKGINDMSLLEYSIQKPPFRMPFMLYAQLSDYYNYDFSNAEKPYYSIQLMDSSANVILG